jgi:hypothetical protein
MPPKFWILRGPHRGKRINVRRYERTANGVAIRIDHNVPAVAGRTHRWVQTIRENGSFFRTCGRRNYVDPFGPHEAVGTLGTIQDYLAGLGITVCTGDDNAPFYYGPGLPFPASGDFVDVPSESAPASGRTWIQFTTSLTEVSGTTVTLLVTISWGFDRMADGRVLVARLRRASWAATQRHINTLRSLFPAYTFQRAT